MKKISSIILFLFLALLPSQFGRHFWPDFSLVLGRRIDYLSPTLYLVDAALIVLATSVFFSRKKISQKIIISAVMLSLFLSIFVFTAIQPFTAVYFSYRLFLIVILATVVVITRPRLSVVLIPLSLGIITSVVLAPLQFFAQSSIGGLWYFLGERTFNLDTPSIAQIIIGGRLLLRPYGTYPHPNVMAGFLTTLLPLFLWWKTQTPLEYVVKRLVVPFSLVGIALSFSRSSWVMLVLILFIYFVMWVLRRPDWLKISVMGIVLLCGIVVLEEFTIGRFVSISSIDSQSLTERAHLADAARHLFFKKPVVGIGPLNFIPALPTVTTPPYLLQPVHSIYLLLLVETGLVGFGFFILMILFLFSKTFKKKNIALFLSLMSLLLLGLVDHYPLTLVPTQWLWGLLAGMILL